MLALNSIYLYIFNSPSLFYLLNIFIHLGAGLISILLLVSLARSFGRLTWDGKGTLALFGLSALLGIFLFFSGATRPYQQVLSAHMLFGALALLALFAHLIARRESWWPLLGTALLASILLPFVVQSAGWKKPYEIENPVLVPLSMEGEGAGRESPFFPSSANTSVNGTIPSDFFMKPETCGKAGCHPDIYEQWSTSAHHIASFNNQWYRKSVEYMQDVVGTEPSKWCGGCHDHAVFFNGMMDQPIKDQLNRPEAKAGLTCTSCHSIVAVRSTMGNGSFVIEYPPLHDLATSENPVLEYLHDFIVELDPGPHRETFIKPFMKEQSSEYCSACHKVHLDEPVNDYRWLRGFNEYDGWQSSGVSGQGARSFYYPESPQDCVDCHMPLVASSDAGNIEGAVHDHRFPGANTALPFVNGFEEQLKLVKDFLQNDQVSVDIFALSEVSEDEERTALSAQQTMQAASTFAEGDELGIAVSGRGAGYTEAQEVLAPIDRVIPIVGRGEEFRVDVVVRTLGVGHFFPGGTVDAFDVWVELKAEDENGRTIFWSGYVPEDEEGRKGPVDPSAHFYRSRMVDGRGNPINKRNAWATRSVAYVRLIPPGAADTVHYRLKIPEDAGDTIHLTARINYRKFSWWNTQWAYAGVRDPADPDPAVASGYDDGNWVFTGDTSGVSGEMKEIPDLPITVMAESTAQLRVVDSSQAIQSQSSVYSNEDLIRWNDYGIGLLLQGDLRAAEQMFMRVTEIDPDFADGWVNIGRARIQEGRTDEAQSVLLEALKRDSDLAKTHFFLGMTYKNQGEYEKALEHLWTAEGQYPRDRVVLNQIGRILFLQRNFMEAVEIFNRVLEIDPEDLQAHYNLMLCFRALRDTERAQHQQALYLRFKADESAESNLGEFLRDHPHDNNERQAIHEHSAFPLEEIRRWSASASTAY